MNRKRLVFAFVLLALIILVLLTGCGPVSNVNYTLTVTISPPGAGIVTPVDGTFKKGSVVTLTATPAEGYIFGIWDGLHGYQVSNNRITMNSDKNINAYFTEPPKSPTVTLNDNNNYQVESAWIGKPSTTSTYIYGIIKIKYLGATDRCFIDVAASFKDIANTEIFLDDSLIYNVVPCKYTSSSDNTNSFFTPTYNYGYYYIIEDLSSYGRTIADISKIDLTITSNSYNYLAPLGTLSTSGSGSQYRIEPDSWYFRVINNGDRTVYSTATRFNYKDSLNRRFKWTFPFLYVNNLIELGGAITNGQSGYFGSTTNTPDYMRTPLEYDDLILEWSPVGLGFNFQSTLQSTLNNQRLSMDEKTKIIKEQIDNYTHQQFE